MKGRFAAVGWLSAPTSIPSLSERGRAMVAGDAFQTRYDGTLVRAERGPADARSSSGHAGGRWYDGRGAEPGLGRRVVSSRNGSCGPKVVQPARSVTDAYDRRVLSFSPVLYLTLAHPFWRVEPDCLDTSRMVSTCLKTRALAWLGSQMEMQWPSSTVLASMCRCARLAFCQSRGPAA